MQFYEIVHRLKHEFPDLDFAVNGGLTTNVQVHEHLRLLDGAMIGREAYHNPWWLAEWDAEFYGAEAQTLTREDVESLMCDYMEREAAEHGTLWYSIARHMLGLRNGLPGARRWRQVWSDHKLKTRPPREVMALAHEPVAQAA